MPIIREPFGSTPDGVAIDRYRLRNAQGIEADIITYGGIVSGLRVPDRHGNLGNIVLGFDNLEQYLGPHPFFGALIGRYGNRIAKGRFTLDGTTYQLACNDGPNHLHGGPLGFDRRVWDGSASESSDGPTLTLRYRSADGEEGYPGNLDITVVYTLTDQNELRIEYTATTDRATVLNLTNHSYFNLAGGGSILNHELTLYASRFVPIDKTQIPFGHLQDVAGTPFDFRSSTPIGERINADDEQIRNGIGYDHCWVLDKPAGELGPVARVYEASSGRVLEAFTTEPGVQFYSGNFLDGTLVGIDGQRYEQRTGLCLEMEHFPDSPNQPQFPSTVLRPGETYRQTTIYRFGLAD